MTQATANQPETRATGGPVRGVARLLRGAGGVGAVTIALVWARAHLPAMVDAWLAKNPPRPSPDLMWMPPPPQSELIFARTQPRTFTMALEAVVVAALAWAAVEALLSRWKAARPLVPVLGAVVAAVGVYAAYDASKFLGLVALVVTPLLALVFARYEPGGEPAPARPSRGLEASVLVLEAIALAWGVWLTCWTAVGIFSALLLVVLVLMMIVVARIVVARTQRHSPERQHVGRGKT